MTQDLFNAILAMDSYNRGYNQAIKLTGTQIGNAVIDKDSLQTPSTSSGQFYNFYAVAYNYGAGKIISYRGTDHSTWDPITGWPGGGAIPNPQTKLAFDFYRDVIGPTADPYTAVVSFTGHSLGGGLAGLVAGATWHSAVIFDNMPFELAAYVDIISANIFGADLRTPNFDYIGAYAVKGEVLSNLRLAQSTPVSPLLPYTSSMSWVDLHSQALLISLLYAKDNGLTDWHSIGMPFINSLFDPNIALGAGAESVPGAKNDVGDYSEILRQAIAYSAIDTGTTIFGNTAIRAMFNDADDLGKVMESDNLSNSLNNPIVTQAISDIFVQFAGQLAIGKVAGNIPVLGGVVSVSPDQGVLTVNLGDALWSIGRVSAQATDIIQGQEDISALFTQTLNNLSSEMQSLWGNYDGKIIDKIEFATYESMLNYTIANRSTVSNNVYMFVDSDSKGVITGSNSNDLILGIGGDDELNGGDGKDLLVGGGGDDYLTGSAGNDVLLGGADFDTLSGGNGNDILDGGADTDILNGGADIDELRGGAGDDILDGGTGADKFVINSGEGFDTLYNKEDSDRVVYNGVTMEGRAVSIENENYKLPSGFILRKFGSDLNIVTDDADSGITIIGFFSAGYDDQKAYTMMGITIPGEKDDSGGGHDAGNLGIPSDYRQVSPIALDLNGDGLKYIPYTYYGSAVHFDIDSDGFAEGLEWLSKDDGFLVIDKNGNGKIDNQKEMFGDDSGTTAYAKLALFDTNQDNKIDSADTGFATLKIWQDLDSDGKTDAGELKTLAQAGITSNDNYVDYMPIRVKVA